MHMDEMLFSLPSYVCTDPPAAAHLACFKNIYNNVFVARQLSSSSILIFNKQRNVFLLQPSPLQRRRSSYLPTNTAYILRVFSSFSANKTKQKCLHPPPEQVLRSRSDTRRLSFARCNETNPAEYL